MGTSHSSTPTTPPIAAGKPTRAAASASLVFPGDKRPSQVLLESSKALLVKLSQAVPALGCDAGAATAGHDTGDGAGGGDRGWVLLYSTWLHGASFERMLNGMVAEGPNLVLVRDTGGRVFGGFADTWKDKHPKFYGNSSSFVFSMSAEACEIFPSTGHNTNFQWLMHTIDGENMYHGVGMGGQMGYHAWAIDSSFEKGHSHSTITYNNTVLASSEVFDVDSVEVWRVGPPERSLEVARALRAKKKTKSVLEDDSNPDKVIVSLGGHNFSDEQYEPPKDGNKGDTQAANKE
ncbi:MTOR-associated protein MEAK7 [Pelomyxa schiedti]|nr:MTOR-associated protein MEAK7 [Pelomyxa schiedti]